MNSPWALTKQGIESQFGVNHFSHGKYPKLIISRLDKQLASSVEEISTITNSQSRFNGPHFFEGHQLRKLE